LEEIWNILDQQPFTIVEYGAGTGLLCRDILEYLRANKKMYDDLRYCIIEKSPSMRFVERKILPEKVYWYDSIKEIEGINGCILSNELVDNFSVHQVVMKKELMEVLKYYSLPMRSFATI
jgi:SAM-dependent MidA family methyltransferase